MHRAISHCSDTRTTYYETDHLLLLLCIILLSSNIMVTRAVLTRSARRRFDFKFRLNREPRPRRSTLTVPRNPIIIIIYSCTSHCSATRTRVNIFSRGRDKGPEATSRYLPHTRVQSFVIFYLFLSFDFAEPPVGLLYI